MVRSLRVDTHDIIWAVREKMSLKNPRSDAETILWEAGLSWNMEEYSDSEQ